MSNDNKAVFAPIYLSLGTNLGNRKANMEMAIKKIEKQIGNIISQSAFYSSEPFGFESDNLFLNCAVEISTTLLPYELLTATQLIEKEMGRTNKTDTKGYSDRIIDIDILFYSNEVICNKTDLIVPHPKIQERDFVLKPLVEIAPNFVHPILKDSMGELYEKI